MRKLYCLLIGCCLAISYSVCVMPIREKVLYYCSYAIGHRCSYHVPNDLMLHSFFLLEAIQLSCSKYSFS